MILSRLTDVPDGHSRVSNPQKARTLFMNSQKNVEAPFAIILQPEHAKLAGDLAAALLDDVFGPLPPEAIRATAEHDLGWQESDTAQLNAIGSRPPLPFPDVSANESIGAGVKSIAKASAVSPLVEVLVSRHFTTLGVGDPARAEFVNSETARRADWELGLQIPPSDLARWTAALGFCDLLSLYLCCGSREPVEFPLAHPADPAAEYAKKVTLAWKDDCPRFSCPVVKSGAHFVLPSRIYAGPGVPLESLMLEWTSISKNPG